VCEIASKSDSDFQVLGNFLIHQGSRPQCHTVKMYASAIITFTHLYTYDLDLSPLTLKTFSAIPTHMMNICDKFIEIPPSTEISR